MSTVLDLAGIGLGPFNLSVAALLEPARELQARFFERRAAFAWHPGQLLRGSSLQTSFLKDLVTPVDPTSRHSFLAFLVAKRRFYEFLHAGQPAVTRAEFAQYLAWVADRLGSLRFGSPIQGVNFTPDGFRLEGPRDVVRARHLVIATGQRPHLPAWASPVPRERCFHVADALDRHTDLTGRRVAIIGGGQSGAEMLLALLRGEWGRPAAIAWVSRRPTFAPLDESHFTNDWFTPGYVEVFRRLSMAARERALVVQKLASDGISPATLAEIAQELYRRRHIDGEASRFTMLPGREVIDLVDRGSVLLLDCVNRLDEAHEQLAADQVILATGFRPALPDCLAPLVSRLAFDGAGRPRFDHRFRLLWDGPDTHRLYLQNAGRHVFGIAEAQLSLMAWRAAVIVNDLAGRMIYDVEPGLPLLNWSSGDAISEAA